MNFIDKQPTIFQSRIAADAVLNRKSPALNSYIARIGAQQTSFRKFHIEAEEGPATYGFMRRHLASITVRSDGTVECANPDFAPNDNEREGIAAEVPEAGWPKSIATSRAYVDDLRAALGVDSALLCEFETLTGGEYLFVQERQYPDPDDPSKKRDLPWSFWSDGHWRPMEPDGLLPLYNLPALASGWRRFMIHEGAMGARKLQEMCHGDTPEARARLAAHPWGERLREYQHLGWAGGAEHSRRTDWSPLRQRVPLDAEIIFVADNDDPGVRAIPEISRTLKRRMHVLRFDDNFPQGFDMADPWPRSKKWLRGKRLVVPPMHDYVQPATWATEAKGEPKAKAKAEGESKAGRPAYRARQDFVKEWVMATTPRCLINRSRPTYLHTTDAFDLDVRPFSDVIETSKLMAKHLTIKVAAVTYSPDEKTGVITEEGRRVFNTFMPSTIRPAPGRIRHFEFFMKLLIPDEVERKNLMRWCATLIEHPETRMHYAVLLISEAQGVGKGTLGSKILAPLVGRHNCSIPTDDDIVNSPYNSWVAHKRLAVVHEMYTGLSRKPYDKLKSTLTEDELQVRRKYLESYDIKNWLHIFACSNSKQALHLDDEDRRWFVPRVSEKPARQRYWAAFNSWLIEGGLSVIRQWAIDFCKEHGPVRIGDRPPNSTIKNEVISISRSDGARLALDFVEHVKAYAAAHPDEGPLVFKVDEIRAWIAMHRGLDMNDRRMEKLMTLRKVLRGAGFFEPDHVPGRPDNRVKLDSSHRAYVVATHPIGPATTLNDVLWYDEEKKVPRMRLKNPNNVVPRGELPIV